MGQRPPPPPPPQGAAGLPRPQRRRGGRAPRAGRAPGDRAFDRVVLAAGRWTEGVANLAGARLPMVDPEVPGSGSPGLLGYTAPVPTRLDRVLTTPPLNVRPEGGGRLVVQALDLDVDADPARPPDRDGEQAQVLLTRLREVLTGTAGARLEDLRVGRRALPADGLTVAGFTSPRVYALATHSGITLGPLLGRWAAEEVVADRPVAALAAFRPDRFRAHDD